MSKPYKNDFIIGVIILAFFSILIVEDIQEIDRLYNFECPIDSRCCYSHLYNTIQNLETLLNLYLIIIIITQISILYYYYKMEKYKCLIVTKK